MNRRTAHTALKTAFEAAGLNGKLATHSMRKSFAQRLYDQTRNIFAVQEMLEHKSIATTQRYLGVNYVTVREAVEKMAFSVHDCYIDTLSHRC
jgi:site-specific recombinase XerD